MGGGKPTCLVTGADKGIGHKLVKQLPSRGFHVIAACLKTAPEDLKGMEEVEWVTDVDVSTEEGSKRLCDAVGDRNIEVVISNAGTAKHEGKTSVDSMFGHLGDMRYQFEVNTLGHIRVLHALEKNIPEGGKFIMITSATGSHTLIAKEEIYQPGTVGYTMSKAAANMLGLHIAKCMKDKNVAVGMVNPGTVDTDVCQECFKGMEVNVSKASTPADKAVSCLLDRIENDINVSNTGKKPAAWTQLVAAVEPTPPLATPLLGGPRPQASSGRPPRATSSPGEGS